MNFYSSKEAAKLLGVSLPTYYKLLEANQVKVMRVGNSIRISSEELDTLVKKLTEKYSTKKGKNDE